MPNIIKFFYIWKNLYHDQQNGPSLHHTDFQVACYFKGGSET